MDRLLAITLMSNKERSGDTRLLVSETLQHLTATGAWVQQSFQLVYPQ